MSTTVQQVQYNFSFSIGRTDAQDAAYCVFGTGDDVGLTDELMLGLAAAFDSLPWPEGTTAHAYVTKHEMNEVQSEGDVAASPPSFI